MASTTSSESPVARVGFDILAENVHAVHRSLQPRHRSTVGAVAAVARTIKSSFTTASSKRAKTTIANDADDETPAKRRGGASSVTPSTSGVAAASRSRRSSLTPSLSSLASDVTAPVSGGEPVAGGDNYFSYSPDEGVVPGHPSLRASVLQPLYRRLSPECIVRLTAGDELIVVVPMDSLRRGDAPCARITPCARIVDFYSRAFAAVARKTLARNEPNELLISDVIGKRHRFRREDKWFFEYPVRVRNYAERDNFSRLYLERGPVDHSWRQGAGINLSVCGYSMMDTVLLQLRHVAYLEIFKRTDDNQFLNESIGFSSNCRDAEKFGPPLLHQLSIFHGCRLGSMEVLMKYYRAMHTCNNRERRRLESARRLISSARAAASDQSAAPLDECVLPDDPDYLLSLIRMELDDQNIDRFVAFVDVTYTKAFVEQYNNFVCADGYLLDRKQIMDMYDLMKTLFPFVHSVIAMTVSSPRSRGERVHLSSFFDVGEDDEDDEDDNADEVDDNRNEVDTNIFENVEHEHDFLTKRERAVLELFIAKLRLRSRKKMRYWAMVPPLANHSMGHNKLPPDHPLHGTGCQLRLVWRRLNEIFESTAKARFDLVTSQSTIAMAFDNWQVSIGKTWQSYGCSNTFLRGVASFMKKSKAILLPEGSLLRSPSGRLFRVTTSAYLDPDSIIVRGQPVHGEHGASAIDDASNDASTIQDSSEIDTPNAELERVTSGNLIWPLMRWKVIRLEGVPPCPTLSYCDPDVPPPLNACVSIDDNMNDILYRSRRFYMSGSANTRPMSSDEYYSRMLDVEDLNNLESFGTYLSNLHDWRREVNLQTVEGFPSSLYVPDGVPLSFDQEHFFVCHMTQCRTLIHRAKCFRGDLLRHLYPKAKCPDRFIHVPLIGRDETSHEGMMLTNASLLESLGLLCKRSDGSGRFDLGPNATERYVFLFGDALSASFYTTLYDKILRQITQLGNEDYIKTLLEAQSRVFIQKGAFHQLMHQLAAIYSQFYGGFMQPFQADNRVKRVSGKPLKDGFQCHEQFAVKLYNACNRFFLRRYCHSVFARDIDGVEFSNDSERILWMLQNFRAFRTSWEVSLHEPSRMIALFMKSMRSYLRCKHAISNQDGWLLEIESCYLLPTWKMLNKNTYLRLQCEYMELFYNDERMSAVNREIMRANAFCVKSSGRSVAFDEENEHYNCLLKRMPVTPSLDLAVMRSRHVIAGNKTAKEMWGLARNRWKRGTSLEDDILDLESLLGISGVFVSTAPCKMTKRYFWDLVRAKGPVGSPRDHDRTTIPYSEHENVIVNVMFRGEVAFDFGDVVNAESELNDNDDQSRGSALSVGTHDESIFDREHDECANHDMENDLEAVLSEEERELLMDKNLRALHMFKKPLHPHATTDLVVMGKLRMRKSLPKARQDALRKQGRKRELIYLSIKYFSKQMEFRRNVLEASLLRSSNLDTVYHIPSWKRRYKEYRRLNNMHV